VAGLGVLTAIGIGTTMVWGSRAMTGAGAIGAMGASATAGTMSGTCGTYEQPANATATGSVNSTARADPAALTP